MAALFYENEFNSESGESELETLSEAAKNVYSNIDREVQNNEVLLISAQSTSKRVLFIKELPKEIKGTPQSCSDNS